MKIESLYKTGEFPLEGDIVRISPEIKNHLKVIKDFNLDSSANQKAFNMLCTHDVHVVSVIDGYTDAQYKYVKECMVLLKYKSHNLWFPTFVLEKVNEDK